jgi:hypothetical protein
MITNFAWHIFVLIKTITMAKTRSCIGWNITVVWDVTPLGRESTLLSRSRTEGRIRFQEAGYSEMLVRVYSVPHTSLWRNVRLNRGANLTVLQPLVLRNWSPIILQSCQTDIPTCCRYIYQCPLSPFLNDPTNDSTYLINVYLSVKDNITCYSISRRDFDEV